ncbi:hypothetical protein QTO34_012994 [Cnephaeus nilssonii]|uniref:Serine/threonine kinase 19 n=1 Tax=Cnephaeus nilssonii TaxID=3371016 RepID=A0AA40HAS1_CNENI|nr:hypothetical protein QTO34_012994 [Eptesicus nilssonii]
MTRSFCASGGPSPRSRGGRSSAAPEPPFAAAAPGPRHEPEEAAPGRGAAGSEAAARRARGRPEAGARVLGGGAPPGSPPRPGSARAAVAELGRLFPRGLFEDALPPIALRSQVYSLVPDRTAADRQLKELQEQGEIRVIQLGFDLDAHGIVLTEDYRTRVLRACDGRSYAGAVQKFLALVLPACGDLSFQQDQMTQTFGFRDTEITQLVNAGVLTVRDAGSWWLAVPGAGRFVKCFVKGRQAVLGMVRKAKYRELLLSELLGRRAPASVRLGLAYHVHDLIGAQLVDCVSTTSGTLLRLPET